MQKTCNKLGLYLTGKLLTAKNTLNVLEPFTA